MRSPCGRPAIMPDASAVIRFCAAILGRDSRRQIQAKRPLRRVEVLEEIAEIRDSGERDADLLDAAERRLRFGFAVLNDAVDHASASTSSARATSWGSKAAGSGV